MKKAIAHIKKYKQDYALVAGVVGIGITSVLGQHWSDAAKTPFWWTFWDVATYVSIVGWVGGWIYFKNKFKNS